MFQILNIKLFLIKKRILYDGNKFLFHKSYSTTNFNKIDYVKKINNTDIKFALCYYVLIHNLIRLDFINVYKHLRNSHIIINFSSRSIL